MLFYRLTAQGAQTIVQLDDIWAGCTAILCGGGPSLTQNDLRRLERPGLLTVAMNNAARHFRPSVWMSSDDPRCFDPWILADPGIMKFANIAHIQTPVAGRKWGAMPATYFYRPTPVADKLDPLAAATHMAWTNNTFMHTVFLLYSMGVRRIGLLGSEFGADKDGRLYAHDTGYSPLQLKWNTGLYGGLAADLVAGHPYYAAKGLEIRDASTPSRISPPYQGQSFDQLVAWALQGYPAERMDPKKLPHCSDFAPERMRAEIAEVQGEPGYSDGLPKGVIGDVL